MPSTATILGFRRIGSLPLQEEEELGARMRYANIVRVLGTIVLTGNYRKFISFRLAFRRCLISTLPLT
jgi:hypothetical protein